MASNKSFRSRYDTTVTPEDLRKAKEELNEDPETRASALNELMELLSCESNLRPRMDEEFLIRFLRVRKFDIQRTFNMIKYHYKIRKLNPNYIRSPLEFAEGVKTCGIVTLPFRDNEGRSIVLMRINNWDTTKFSAINVASLLFMVLEFLTYNPVDQVNGVIIIYDIQGATFQHVKCIASPSFIKLAVTLILDCVPIRFKYICAVNVHPVLYNVYMMFKYLLKKKIRERVKFLRDLSELHQFIDPAILPVEYGGQIELDETTFIEKVLETNSDIVHDRAYGYITKPT